MLKLWMPARICAVGWRDRQMVGGAMRGKSKAGCHCGECWFHAASFQEFSMAVPCQRGVCRWTQVVNCKENGTQVDIGSTCGHTHEVCGGSMGNILDAPRSACNTDPHPLFSTAMSSNSSIAPADTDADSLRPRILPR